MAHHETLDKATFDRWRAEAAILERDAHGDKVLRLANGLILKLFRGRRGISARRWFPDSGRFARHARALLAHGIPTVAVQTLYRLPETGQWAVLYDPLPGEPLRDAGLHHTLDTATAAATGTFIARLHQHGILFRSLHLGNILQLPDGRLGLIDIADMVVRPFSLTDWQRGRNFRHFFRYRDNRWVLSPANADALVQAYCSAYPGHRRLEKLLANLLAEHRATFTGEAP